MSGAALRVAEMFGATFQGEGPSAGQRAAFIRLSGCPLSCSWCDEPQTWDWSRFDRAAESQVLTADQVLAWAAGDPAKLVVITGGEPLSQQRALAGLVSALAAGGRRVEIETSGVITPVPELAASVTAFNVSPKLASSAVPYARRIRPDALAWFAASGKAVFKFVACTREDLDGKRIIAEWRALIHEHQLIVITAWVPEADPGAAQLTTRFVSSANWVTSAPVSLGQVSPAASPAVPSSAAPQYQFPAAMSGEETVFVQGHFRKNGTYVQPHLRRPTR